MIKMEKTESIGCLAGWHYMPIVKFNLDCSLQNVLFFSFGNGKNINFFSVPKQFHLYTNWCIVYICMWSECSPVSHSFVHTGHERVSFNSIFFLYFSCLETFDAKNSYRPSFFRWPIQGYRFSKVLSIGRVCGNIRTL